MTNYILIDGVPTPEEDLFKWARWFATTDRRVAATEVGGATVSTIFLGLDHGFGGRPLLYETMIFGGPHDEDQWRYSTLEEARAGHEAAVSMLRVDDFNPRDVSILGGDPSP